LTAAASPRQRIERDDVETSRPVRNARHAAAAFRGRSSNYRRDAAIFVGIVAADVFVSILLRYFFGYSIPDSYDFGRLLLAS